MLIPAVYSYRTPEDICWPPNAAAASQVCWQPMWQPLSLHKNKFCSLGLWNANAWCLLWAAGHVFWGTMLSPKTLLAAEPRQPICLGNPVIQEGASWLHLEGSLPRSKEPAASPLWGNPFLLGGKILRPVPDSGFLSPGQPWCLGVCSPASPASCPVSLCVWLCLREASLMGQQLLCVVLGQTLSDSTFDVGHCSPKTRPRNVGQG